MRPLRVLRLLAVVSVFGLLLAACPADEPVVEPEPEVEEPEVEEPEVEEPDEPVRGDGVLRIGYVLPETGALQSLGPPTIGGAELAVEEINAAGGVLGNPVELLASDEAGDAGVAGQNVNRLLAQGVDAIVGAAANAISRAVIDQITGSEVVQCSPSNKSPMFTDYDDGGYYFRNTPSDALQGPALAETIVGDGHTRVAVMGRVDEYGQALADTTANALSEADVDVTATIIYDHEAATFDAEVSQAMADNPDAVALAAFDEGVHIIQALLRAGMTPEQLYATDGLAITTLNQLIDSADPNVIDGMRGTTVAAVTDEDFAAQLREHTGQDDTRFGAESFDCVMVIALAVTAVGSDDPREFVSQMIAVTRPPGTKCTSFRECVELLEAGEEIDYDGASGPLDYSDVGEPARGVHDVWEWRDGEHVVIRQLESTIE